MAQVATTRHVQPRATRPDRACGPPPSATRSKNKGARDQARAPRRGRQGLGRDERDSSGDGAERLDARGRARRGAGARADRRARDRGAGRRRREHRLQRRRRRSSGSRTTSGTTLKDEISKPPTCGHGAKSNDLVKLGKLLREHGFAVAENAEMGDNPRPGVHAEDGFHYKCRHSGALDVNADNGPGTEKADHRRDRRPRSRSSASARSGRRPGHFDHIHIDVANSGAIGVGGGAGGAVGALEETGLDVKLIDWDADVRAVRRLRRPGRGRLLRRPAGPGDRARSSARCSTATTRSPKVAAVGVRGRDRRVRRAQPPLRRPRLGRRLPAAAVGEGLGHGGADHGPRARGDELRPHGDRPPDRQGARPERGRSSRRRSRARASRCATTRCRCRRCAMMNKYCG